MKSKFCVKFLIGTLLLVFLFYSCGNPRNIITANPLPDWWVDREFTVSEMYYIQPKPALILEYNYYVNGVKYNGSWVPARGSNMYSLNTNYEIAYNPKKPDEHFLLIYRPVFEEQQMSATTLTGIMFSNHIILRKKRPELLLNELVFPYSFGMHSYNINKSEVTSMYTIVEHHDTMAYFVNNQHRVYLVSYKESDPIIFRLHYEYPIGLDKYSWTRFMGGEVTNARLRKIQRRSRRFVKRHGNGAYYYYPNAYGKVPMSRASIEKLQNFIPKDRKGNELDVDIVIVTDSLINAYYDEYKHVMEKWKK